MLKKIPVFSCAALALASFFVRPSADAAQVDLKKAAPADSIVFLSAEDFPAYMNVYPKDALEGAILMQTNGLAGGNLELESLQAVMQKFMELSKSFSGQVVFSASVKDEAPLIQLLADYSGDLKSLESAFSEAEHFGEAEAGETIGDFAFASRAINEEISLHYAVAKGRLILATDMDLARQSVEALGGKALDAAIESSPVYKKALSFAKNYDGALGLVQLTDEFWSLVDPNVGEAGAVMAALGVRNIEGMFIAYPKGERVLKESMGGVLVKAGPSAIDLYKKPAGDLKLPVWASADSYINFSMQIDLPHLKDGILALAEKLSPGSSEGYEQSNQMAGMMIGVTIDDLLSKGLGDQISMSVDMDMAVMSKMMKPVMTKPGDPAPASPMKAVLLNIKVKDRKVLEGLVTAILAQAQGMVQKSEVDGATFLSAPSMVPGAPAGTSMNLALTETDLFIQLGQVEELKGILKRSSGEVTGAFANAPMKRIFPPLSTEAISVMTINYASFFGMMEDIYLDNSDGKLAEADLEKIKVYFEFLKHLMDEVAVVTTESEGAYLFSLGIGK